MKITKLPDGDKLTVKIEGRLDTTTAPELENELKASYEGVSEMLLDVSQMEYISSAGLRVFLSAHKTMSKQGILKVKGANPDIIEIFEVTGFSDILNLE